MPCVLRAYGKDFEVDSFLEHSKLIKFAGVENVHLDFGIERRDTFTQYDYFPPKLLTLAGELGIRIELSQYPISKEQKSK
jgi:hypothetical protein